MSSTIKNEELYKFIVRENQHRLKVLNCFNNPFPDDRYYLYNTAMIELSNKLIKQLSFSTNYIRRNILKECNIVSAGYHLSKSRLDYYNGNYSQVGNTNTIFNMLRTIDTEKYKYYFVTIDYLHMNNFLNLGAILTNMKYFMNHFVHSELFNKLNGLIVKYETNWNIYDKTLVLSPHYHLIIKLNNKSNSTVLEELKECFSQIVINPEKDVNIKEVTDSEQSYYNISKYIAKDVYYRVFHYIDKNKTVDSYNIPYSDIVFVILMLNNFQFFNSYKELYFKQSYR